MLRYTYRGQRGEVERLAKRLEFYRTLNQKLTLEVIKARSILDAQQPEENPIIKEEPINEKLQTGESRLLGGPMSISAPYRKTESMDDLQP
jgi:hypothetical protein